VGVVHESDDEDETERVGYVRRWSVPVDEVRWDTPAGHEDSMSGMAAGHMWLDEAPFLRTVDDAEEMLSRYRSAAGTMSELVTQQTDRLGGAYPGPDMSLVDRIAAAGDVTPALRDRIVAGARELVQRIRDGDSVVDADRLAEYQRVIWENHRMGSPVSTGRYQRSWDAPHPPCRSMWDWGPIGVGSPLWDWQAVAPDSVPSPSGEWSRRVPESVMHVDTDQADDPNVVRRMRETERHELGRMVDSTPNVWGLTGARARTGDERADPDDMDLFLAEAAALAMMEEFKSVDKTFDDRCKELLT